MIPLVVFDLAGTTVHDGDSVGACFRAALAGVGVTPDPDTVNDVMGLPKPEAIRILLTQSGRTDPVGPIHDDFIARMKHFYALDPSVREIDGAAAAFARLRERGVKVAVNTGFSRDIVDVLLHRLGWREPDALDASITSDEVERGRPHPDMIRALMRRFGIDDARAVAKVGDTWADLDEGTNAGCGLVIGVTTGAFTEERLRQRPHTHIVASLAEVVALIERGER